MTTKHLTDIDIQLFISDKESCKPFIVLHMENCDHCKEKAYLYEAIFQTIKQQPTPVFDFNLSDLVLSQVPQTRNKFLWSSLINPILIFSGICTTVVLIFLIEKYLLPNSGANSNQVSSLIFSTAIIIMLFQVIDLYRKYQIKMSTLN